MEKPAVDCAFDRLPLPGSEESVTLVLLGRDSEWENLVVGRTTARESAEQQSDLVVLVSVNKGSAATTRALSSLTDPSGPQR